MKREDLKKLLGESATDEVLNQIMTWNGEDINSHKTTATDLQTKLDTATKQLTDANSQIESFKGLDVEGVKKAADDWKAKYEQATNEAAANLAKVKFDYALESALTTAKAKNPKAVTALLSTDEIKNAKGEFTQELFDKQLAAVRKDNEYLFADAKEPPKIVLGGSNPNNSDNKGTFADAISEALNKGK